MRSVSRSRDAGGNKDEGCGPGRGRDGKRKSGHIKGIEEGKEGLGVVVTELRLPESIDEDQGVGWMVGVSGEEVGFVVAGQRLFFQ